MPRDPLQVPEANEAARDWAVAGALCALLLVLLDLALGGTWRLQGDAGFATLVRALLLLAAAGLVVVLLIALGSRLLALAPRPRSVTAGLALVALVIAGLLTPGLFAGPQARTLPLVALYPWLLGLLAAAAVVVARVAAQRNRRALGLLVLGLAGTAVAVDRFVFTGHYPTFHHLLAGLAFFGLGLGCWLVVPRSARSRRRLVLRGCALALGAAGIVSGHAILSDPGATAAVRTRTLLARRALRFLPAPEWAPPPASDEDDPTDRAHARSAALHAAAVDARGDATRPSILLITIDALRHDRGPGSTRGPDVAPRIDAWGRRGLRFDRAYAPTVITWPSCRSIMTGRYPDSFLGGDLLPPPPTLPGRLAKRGYRRHFLGGLVIIEPRDARWLPELEGAFDTLEQPLTIQQMVTRVREIAKGPEPWFVWMHPFEVHHPYKPPPGFARGDSLEELYDGQVRHLDSILGPLLEELPEDVWVILTADHGEEMSREHGFTGHGASLYESAIRVPLILRGPGVTPGVVNEVVSLVDLLPTIEGLAGGREPPQTDGLSLLPVLDGQTEHLALRDGVFAERRFGNVLQELPNPMTAFVQKGQKAIVTDRPATLEVYDLKADAAEQKNLLSSREAAERERAGRVLARRRLRFDGRMRRWAKGDRAEVLTSQGGGAEDTARLVALLGREDAAVRRQALRALAAASHPELRPRFRELLDDPDARVRAWAAVAIGRSTPDEETWPVDRALRGEDPAAREAALDLLVETPRLEAVEALLSLVDAATPSLSWREVVILNALGHLQGLRFTERMLENPEAFMPGVKNVVYNLARRRRPEIPGLLERHFDRLAANDDCAASLVHIATLYSGPRMVALLDRLLSDARLSGPDGAAERANVQRVRGLCLREAGRARDALARLKGGEPWMFGPAPVSFGLAPGISLLAPAPGAMRPEDWAAPHDVVPVRPLARREVALELPAPAGAQRLVVQVFALAATNLDVRVGEGTWTACALRPADQILVLPLPGSADPAKPLRVTLRLGEGSDPGHVGVGEIALVTQS